MTEKLTIHQAMTAVSEDVGAVAKSDKNQAQKFNFRGIDAVVNAVSPAMRKHGVTVYPSLDTHTRGQAVTGKGSTMNTVDVIVSFTFTGPDGSSITAKVPGEAFDSGDKATAKAMSVAFRTALLQTFTLPTDETDPDADSYDAQRPARPAPANVDWQAEILANRNDYQSMLTLHAKAKGLGAPQAVLEQIVAEGKAASERNLA